VFGQFGNVPEILVARVAEMSCAEAEEDGHGAAVAALVLEVIRAVAGAHLGAGHIAAPAAHQLGRIEAFTDPTGRSVASVASATEGELRLAPRFSAVVRLKYDHIIHHLQEPWRILVNPSMPQGCSILV